MIDTSALTMPTPANQLDALLRKGNKTAAAPNNGKLEETFQDFVGQTFFGQMISSMRQSVGKPAYFHGGRGEEVFQGQLDQIMAEKMTEASAEQFTEPMLNLFMLSRS